MVPLVEIASGASDVAHFVLKDGSVEVGEVSLSVVMRQTCPIRVALTDFSATVEGTLPVPVDDTCLMWSLVGPTGQPEHRCTPHGVLGGDVIAFVSAIVRATRESAGWRWLWKRLLSV